MNLNSATLSLPLAAPSSFLERHLSLACRHASVLNRVIETHGQRALGDYLAQLRNRVLPGMKVHADVLHIVADYTAALLGEGVASRLCRQLESRPCALTANHHGVDYFAQSVQGTLLFSLSDPGETRPAAVPVFACGVVPLDNLTYPLGMLFYEPGARAVGRLPLHLPIFSNKARRALVHAAGAMTEEMVQRAGTRIKKLIMEKSLPPTTGEVALDILEEEYAAEDVLKLPDYSSQAVVLNHRIWRRLHNHAETSPDLVYLELERITSALLLRDLANPDSLISQILFDDAFRQAIIANLNGARACWDTAALSRRLREGSGGAGAGTMFFWGINDRGRQVPLFLNDALNSQPRLEGVDDKGITIAIPFEPEALMDGLRARRIVPALFTSFTALSFARGIRCLGGYYQAEYLPAMQAGVVQALEQSHDGRMLAARVRAVCTQGYLGGMQTIMQQVNGQGLAPAGVLEMLAAGGLNAGHRLRARGMSVRDAHLVSLMETLDDLGLDRNLAPNWRQELMQATEADLAQRVVIL